MLLEAAGPNPVRSRRRFGSQKLDGVTGEKEAHLMSLGGRRPCDQQCECRARRVLGAGREVDE